MAHLVLIALGGLNICALMFCFTCLIFDGVKYLRHKFILNINLLIFLKIYILVHCGFVLQHLIFWIWSFLSWLICNELIYIIGMSHIFLTIISKYLSIYLFIYLSISRISEFWISKFWIIRLYALKCWIMCWF